MNGVDSLWVLNVLDQILQFLWRIGRQARKGGSLPQTCQQVHLEIVMHVVVIVPGVEWPNSVSRHIIGDVPQPCPIERRRERRQQWCKGFVTVRQGKTRRCSQSTQYCKDSRVGSRGNVVGECQSRVTRGGGIEVELSR